jgi:hypothetical protein
MCGRIIHPAQHDPAAVVFEQPTPIQAAQDDTDQMEGSVATITLRQETKKQGLMELVREICTGR